MATVVYSEHLRLRLRLRNIPEQYPQLIYEQAEQRYHDVTEKNDIAIKRLEYNQKLRSMMIAYEVKGDVINVITIHPITDEKIINRVIRKRWIKHG